MHIKIPDLTDHVRRALCVPDAKDSKAYPSKPTVGERIYDEKEELIKTWDGKTWVPLATKFLK